MNKYFLLMCLALVLMMSWHWVDHIDTKFDWFLFLDFSQKPKWYVYYSSQHIENIIYTFVIFNVIKSYAPKYRTIAAVFFGFACFRLIEYWLFRHHIPMYPILGGMLIYVIGSLYYKRHGN